MHLCSSSAMVHWRTILTGIHLASFLFFLFLNRIKVNRQLEAMLIVRLLNGCCMHNEIMVARKSLLTKNYLLKQWIIWWKILAIFKINLRLFGIVEHAGREHGTIPFRQPWPPLDYSDRDNGLGGASFMKYLLFVRTHFEWLVTRN